METWLITGGAGFIGSCLVRQLIANTDAHVVNLDLLTYASSQRSLDQIAGNPRHTFVKGDITDASLVAQLLAKHQPVGIVNLAAESHVDRSIDGPRRFIETNIVGTFTLLDESRKYIDQLPSRQRDAFRFVHVSSDEVFGSLGMDGIFDEHSQYAPNSPYAASKASSDHLVRSYCNTYRLPAIVTNSSNNYGPYQFPEKLVPLMTLNALEGKPLPIYGNGLQVRDWLHVADHAAALRLVMANGVAGETYCIGGDCEHTNLEVVNAICDAVDQRTNAVNGHAARNLIEFVTDRPGHDQRYAIDSNKIQTELGWQPVYDFATGISQTVDWYANNTEWAQEVAGELYNRQRMGLTGTSAAASDVTPTGKR